MHRRTHFWLWVESRLSFLDRFLHSWWDLNENLIWSWGFLLICQMFVAFRGSWYRYIYPYFYRDKCIILWLGFSPLFRNVLLQFVFVVQMPSVCFADAQYFWILIWIVFFTIMITACLVSLLSQTELYYSWMLLFSYMWLIIFDLLLLLTCFYLDVGGSGRLHISLNQ